MKRRKPATKRNVFRWDAAKNEAAQLLAEGDFSVEEIAAKVGVERTTLWRWREHPAFAARVEELTKRLGVISLRRVIARQNRRLLALEDRWLRMQRVIEARADDPDHQRAPGGDTGLLVRRKRMIGSGDNALLVEEFEVDTGLLRELREHEKQVAQECGQWTEKQHHTGEVQQRIVVDLSQFNDQELDQLERLARRAVGPGNDPGGTGAA